MTSWATRSYYGQVSGLKKSSEMQYDLAVLTPTPSYFLSNGSHSLVWRSIPRPAKAGDDKVRQNCLAFLSRNGNVTETWKQKSFPDYSWAQKHLNLSAADFISFQHYNFLASCLQTCTVATNWQNCRGADTSEAVWYGLIHLIFRYLWFLYIHVFFPFLYLHVAITSWNHSLSLRLRVTEESPWNRRASSVLTFPVWPGKCRADQQAFEVLSEFTQGFHQENITRTLCGMTTLTLSLTLFLPYNAYRAG